MIRYRKLLGLDFRLVVAKPILETRLQNTEQEQFVSDFSVADALCSL